MTQPRHTLAYERIIAVSFVIVMLRPAHASAQTASFGYVVGAPMLANSLGDR